MDEYSAIDDDYPRSMRDAAVRERRRAMLHEAHIEPLTEFAESLRRPDIEVPDFDPFDGGMNAEILFLFEKPGPKTSERNKRAGSGFISRNNDDPTAEATFHFMRQAQIPRELTITWNVIPWWNGTTKLLAHERRQGIARLDELIRLLPRIKAVVLVGKNAGKAKPLIEQHHPTLQLFESAHPALRVRNTRPDVWRAIPTIWEKAYSSTR